MIQIDLILKNKLWESLGFNIRSLSKKVVKTAILKSRIWPKICSQKSSVALLLTDDKQLRELNSRYRNKDKSTNFLSFPGIEDWDKVESGELFLGDIAGSYQNVMQEAEIVFTKMSSTADQNITLQHYFIYTLAHSTLHLCGYTHDCDKTAASMTAVEADILNTLIGSDEILQERYYPWYADEEKKG